MIEPPLHDYQMAASVHLIYSEPGAGLFMSPGLGKTATVLRSLVPDFLPALVVAPKTVAEETWPREAKKWRPDLQLQVAKGSPAKRIDTLNGSADVVAISMDSLWDRQRRKPHLHPKHRFKTIILDESQSFANHSSSRSRAVRQIAKGRRTWLLSGTPAPRGLESLWHQLKVVDGGARLHPTLGRFRAEYFDLSLTPTRVRQGGKVIERHLEQYDLKEGAEERIWDAVGDICLSQRSGLQLPPYSENRLVVDLPQDAEEIREVLKQSLAADFGEHGELTAASSGVLSSLLMQLSSGFCYHNKEEVLLGKPPVLEFNTAKIDKLEELVDSLAGDPLLLAVEFRHDLERIQKRFAGKVFTKKDDNWFDRWNEGELPILAAHRRSLAAGLNLQQGGHTVCWLTATFSGADDEQFNARVYRQGQTKPVVVHRMWTPMDALANRAARGKIKTNEALLTYLQG